ncbi:MAG: thioredoxin [Aquificae bacterium]|nr:thioredoxin [Aquificota bacterium]
MFEGFKEVNDRDFYKTVMMNQKPSVVVFLDPSSGENEKVLSVLRKYQKLYGDKIDFFYLDVTKNTSFEDFGIFNFPSVLYFRDTMELDRHDFIPTEELVEQAIKRLLRLA